MKKGIQPNRIDPAFLMELAEPMEDVYEAIQHDLIVNLARRLRKHGKLRRGDQWRALMLAETGAVHDEAMKTIAGSAGAIASLEEAVVREAVVAAIDAVEPALAGQLRQPDYVPAVSQTVQRVTDTYSRQALNRLNLVNTVMLNSTLSAYRKAVDDTAAIERQLAEAQKTLNRETGAVIVGTKTHHQAIRDAVTAMARNGLTGFIDKAGRNWTPQAYVSMDVHTTTANAARQAAMDRNEAHDNHLISVSSHPGARPKCAPWQGRIYSTDGTSGTARDLNGKEYEYIPLASTSYGEPDGLFGINCGHFPSPFIDGFSVMRYEPTKDMDENAREYRENQQQRYMERRIRAVKTEADALEAAGDAEGAKAARRKARQLNAELKAWCAENKRDYYPERTRIVKPVDILLEHNLETEHIPYSDFSKPDWSTMSAFANKDTRLTNMLMSEDVVQYFSAVNEILNDPSFGLPPSTWNGQVYTKSSEEMNDASGKTGDGYYVLINELYAKDLTTAIHEDLHLRSIMRIPLQERKRARNLYSPIEEAVVQTLAEEVQLKRGITPRRTYQTQVNALRSICRITDRRDVYAFTRELIDMPPEKRYNSLRQKVMKYADENPGMRFLIREEIKASLVALHVVVGGLNDGDGNNDVRE